MTITEFEALAKDRNRKEFWIHTSTGILVKLTRSQVIKWAKNSLAYEGLNGRPVLALVYPDSISVGMQSKFHGVQEVTP